MSREALGHGDHRPVVLSLPNTFNTVLQVVVTPAPPTPENHKAILLLVPNCNFVAVINENVSLCVFFGHPCERPKGSQSIG